MRRWGSLLVVFCFVLFAGVADPAEDPPRILATFPASGSGRVPPSLDSILVVFDRDMDRGSYSIVGAEGGEVPPLGKGVEWLGTRTARIVLDELAAGRAYALGLNGERHKGFRSAGGTALDPVVVRFRTAGPGETACPVVVGTEPGPGATGVDPGLSEILVTFSEDVRKGGMSLLRMPGATKLGYVRKTPPYLKSPRVLAIPVRLKPGTTYGAFVNGPAKSGFVADKSGEPFLPFPIVFTTGVSGAKPPPPPAGIAGRWSTSEGGARITIELGADGKYRYVASFGGETETTRGTWREKEGTLVLAEEGGAEPLRIPFRRPDNGSLEVQMEGAWIRLVRERPAPSARAEVPVVPSPVSKKLVGAWEWSNGEQALRITLKADGAYEYWSRIKGRESTSRGRWQDLAKEVRITSEDGRDVRIPYRLVDSDTLELTLGTSGPVRLTRGGKATPAPVPKPAPTPRPSLAGTWSWCGQDAEVRIVLGADGRFSYRGREGVDVENAKGTWRDLGTALEIREEGVEKPLKVPYRFVDGRLEIELEGTRIPLTRKN